MHSAGRDGIGPEVADELAKLDKKPEVLAFSAGGREGSFEAPAKEFVSGPYYAAAEEVLPELVDTHVSVAGDLASSTGLNFSFDRRNFMRLFGLSTVASAGACVRRPAEHAIPYVQQPVDTVPGVATHYATTCASCPAGCGVIAKTKEGRPTKLEGNPEHPVNQGGLCSRGQAEIQGLFHPERLASPMIRHGQRLDPVSWDEVIEQVAGKISSTTKIGIFTRGSTGNRNDFFKDVLLKLGSKDENLYTWEPNSLYAAMAKAYSIAFGVSDLPRHEFKEARVVLGIGSDFQEVGISPVYATKGFTQGHSFKNKQMGEFVQFESILTITGSRSDTRHVIPPGSENLVALLVVKSLLDNKNSKGSTDARMRIKEVIDGIGNKLVEGYNTLGIGREIFDELAIKLLNSPSIVVAGGSASFDENATLLQLTTIFANILTGSYGKTLYLDKGWFPSPVRTGDLERFLKQASELDVLFVIDSNPIFATPQSWQIKELLEKIPTVISMQSFPNEVDLVSKFVLPNHHPLESWGDEQPVSGFWSARQPVVRPTTESRQAEDLLLWFCAKAGKSLPYADYRAYLMNKWHALYNILGVKTDFDTFFKMVLRKGFSGSLQERTVSDLKEIKSYYSGYKLPEKGMRLVSPLDYRLYDGSSAHLPILQEIGDAMTTIAWDSCVAINPNLMLKLGLRRNQVVEVSSSTGKFEAAVYPLPGLHPDAILTSRGNGHEDERSQMSYKNGVNPLVVYPVAKDALSAEPVTSLEKVKLTATDKWFRLATMQKHNDIANRKDVVKKIPLKEAKEKHELKNLDDVPDLFPKLPEGEYRWGLAIDLNKCNGCGACMVACGIENNVPQVGREQIVKGREMHWVRLDRYFFGDVDNPVTTIQPIMCQHCNHAPCEAVCPVFATTHDPEGLNTMTYNRCVGTRYCANACPYKVRRFNWWTYKWGEIGERLQDRNPRALNPDVTVRTRGVMEKCTFCVGRLRDGKHKAKAEQRLLVDGEVMTACQQTCPTDAISFGNLKDSDSLITAARKDPRAYLLLGGAPEHGHFGLKTLPNVSYLADVTIEEPEMGFKDLWNTTRPGASGPGYSSESEHGHAHHKG